MDQFPEPETGRPSPLGATWDGEGTNFALFSAAAESVELCLFSEAGVETRIVLPEATDQIWHGYLPGVAPGAHYGYRVHGPFKPDHGQWFNPAKLLIDPYARALNRSVVYDPLQVAVVEDDGALIPDPRDSASVMPRCIVTAPGADQGRSELPQTAWADTIIYEGHVKGLTRLDQSVPENGRGTFAGLARPRLLDHLTQLGVTAVELLPVHAFMSEAHFQEKRLSNYWGYNSIGFFAPEPGYLGTDNPVEGADEFRAMVDRFHSAGIEVLLDVVYNHSAEADDLGPMLSFRGIDNQSYYHLMPDDPRHYINDTGTGNTINASHPHVARLILDSLRYWVEDMHVDGFRFDLATTLGRHADGFDPDGTFLNALRQDSVLGRVKLIAEPWDIGPGGYQLGQFPAGMAEWNDRFRDGVRQYWRGDEGMLPELASRLLGSAEFFDHDDRRPWSSVNYVTAHDGFSLMDTVSFADRHNEANGEDGQDGHSENYSANYGVEGPSDDPALVALRLRQMRNMMATLMLAQGTPMLLAGDEIANSQSGNNNAYAQDNETTWLDWANAGEDAHGLCRFLAHAIDVRKSDPLISHQQFFHGESVFQNGERNVNWFTPQGSEKSEQDWSDVNARAMALRLQLPVSDGNGETLAQATLIVLNAHSDHVEFSLPDPPENMLWQRILDTGEPEFRPEGDSGLVQSPNFSVAGHTVIAFRAITAAA